MFLDGDWSFELVWFSSLGSARISCYLYLLAL